MVIYVITVMFNASCVVFLQHPALKVFLKISDGNQTLRTSSDALNL